MTGERETSEPLQNRIERLITERGYISVAEYMELCATHYYATRDPFGERGDFTTAPEISQVFGELAGAWLFDRWQHQSASQAVLCEVGPGRGTLMKDMLRATRNSGFHESVDIMLVETSPFLRSLQARNLAYAHTRITWVQSLASLPPLPLFLVANEFFDALPVRQFAGKAERNVILEGGHLRFAPDAPVTREESPSGREVMRAIAAHIKTHGGTALIIDYGYENVPHGDSLQALRGHQSVSPLLDPGEADITAHVDFGALKHAALEAGAYVSGTVAQGDFLSRIGAELRAAALCRNASDEQRSKILSGVDRLLSPQQMGRLFKVMAVTSEPGGLAGF